jgi:hypothetical protein
MLPISSIVEAICICTQGRPFSTESIREQLGDIGIKGEVLVIDLQSADT